MDKVEAKQFMDWLEDGVLRGWVSVPVCDTHEGPQLTEEEAREFDEGGDPCIVVMRVWQ